METSFFLVFLFSFYSCIHKIFSTTTDVITTNQFIIDGETAVSSGGTFEMGFFSPVSSSNRYIGIWYTQILPVQTVVWVANREKPLTNTSSVVLKVTKPGILALLNGKNETIWSSNTSRSAENPVALLLDSGNLLVKDANDDNRPENFLWQSFDFPTDTHMPDMKIGKNFKTGHEAYLSAWKNDNDPTPGEFSLHVDPTGYPQLLIKRGTSVSGRAGPWNVLQGIVAPLTKQVGIYRAQYVFNEEEVYASTSLVNNSILSRVIMTNNGRIQRLTWVDGSKSWHLDLDLPNDSCDTYSLCGAYGSCDMDNLNNSPLCGCLDKFVAKYPQQWEKGDRSEGCVRKTTLDCNKKHVFIKYSGIKLPDTKYSQYDKTMTLEGCRQECSRNCSCTAYSSLDIISGDKGCLFWFGELIDIRKMTEGGLGQDINVKMDSSELVSEADSDRKKAEILIVTFSLLMAMILLSLILLLYIRKKKNLKSNEDFELPLFELSTITRSTNNFSVNNKIGEGGYGPVY